MGKFIVRDMITSSLLLSLIVFIVIIALIWWVVNTIGLPPMVLKVAQVLLVIVAVLYLLNLVSPGLITP